MGFLNPLFLLAGAAVLVPIILHLFYRQESKIFTFPAIRYLLRTEREHARQIRTQQLLLLLLRAAIVVLLVLLGARIHTPGAGGSHDPTALALVIDNSLSTTIIQDGSRLLDTLKAVARQSVANASHDDVIWVVRAGTPWEPAVPGGVPQARSAIDATLPAHTFGDLGRAIERARALVGQSELPDREVHVFTDLQATAL
ncbi:MAG: VWA domain-containing protein, partial [Gemmatimonadetes bacterium]|nr:VWA domain-containing protein [Gemmatimonadota bacterium]